MPAALPTTPRVSKKQQTRERILANAIALFRRRGIRRTRLTEIAAASGISPATLFNYFPTKGRLAEAWVRGEVEKLLDAAIGDSIERDRSLRSAVRIASRECSEASKDEPILRLEAWQEAGRASASRLSPDSPLVVGLRREQEGEHVRADLSAVVLAEMLIDAIEAGLIAGLRSGSVSGASPSPVEAIQAELFGAIKARVDLVLDGFRKRNERVSAPAPGRRRPA